MQLVYFILCCYGLTNILVYGRIFNRIRPTYHFFHCPMCIGFWVGASLTGLNAFTELFTYEVSLMNMLLLGSLGSGASYSLCMLISDGGLQHEQKIRRDLDPQVDAKTRNQLLQG